MDDAMLTDDVAMAAIEAFHRNGVTCLRGVLDQRWLDRLRAATEAEMVAPGPMALDLTRGQAGRFFGNTFLMHHRDEFRAFVHEGPCARSAAAVMRSQSATLLFDQVLVKEPGTETPTMWHHDYTYWPVAGDQICTVWIALDRVTADSGAVEFVAGSHRWGSRFRPRSFTGDDRYQTDLPEIPDIDAQRDRHEIIQFELEPGDCTIHHALTMHGAPGNRRLDRMRRGYIQRWCGDDASWNPRPGIQPMLRDPGLNPGAHLACELFPLVWRDAS
jgi:ectoine hydroxylase-related dioxygenase (phytanoyl-CoA dioxygenase family)